LQHPLQFKGYLIGTRSCTFDKWWSCDQLFAPISYALAQGVAVLHGMNYYIIFSTILIKHEQIC